MALETWLRQVERELLHSSPAAVLDLAESFIESDAIFFERADDSYGDIGHAMDAGCRLWLVAASMCEQPPDGWLPRLTKLLSGDDYGGRRELLLQAGQLLDQIELARLKASLRAGTQGRRAWPRDQPLQWQLCEVLAISGYEVCYSCTEAAQLLPPCVALSF